jgi:hypothetical protein
MSRMPRRLTILAIALLTLASVPAAHACPMCKETVADPGSFDVSAGGTPGAPGDITNAQTAATTPQLGDAFNYSILLMLAVPYSLLAAGGATAFVLYRRNQRTASRPA